MWVFLRVYSNNTEMFSDLSCFCWLSDISCCYAKKKKMLSVVWAFWGAWGGRKAKKIKTKQKNLLPNLMSSSYETNPPPCLVPSTVRYLFIRTNIDYAVTNTWGFSNQCSFFSRPDLTPNMTLSQSSSIGKCSMKKISTHHVCTSVSIYDSASFLLVDEYSKGWLTW